MFTLGKLVNMQKPLTTSILSNPNHEFVKLVLYIYSMQSFVFIEMNKASRDKDLSKIEYYGPLASVLGYILHAANQNRKHKLPNNFTVYRGLKLSKDDIEAKYTVGKQINLLGFTSSTIDRNTALSFTID